MNTKSRSHYERFQRYVGLAVRMETALPDDLDWSSVVRFYSALHLLDAFLSGKTFPFVIDSHPLRNRAIRMSPELQRFGSSYHELQQLSEQVRYDPDFLYTAEHHAAAQRNLAKIVAVLEPKVKRLLGIS